jgi:ABC-type ATPase with predicted acetyltransferase domain
MRGVTKRLHAGVPGCRASARVLADIDFVMRHGDRVAVVEASSHGACCAARTLLLVAAGIARPDAGTVWRAPGARLACVHETVSVAVRGVAERDIGAESTGRAEMLCWPDAAAALIVVAALPDARRFHAGRIALLRAGALHLLHESASPGRVDSAVGAT